MAPIPKTHFIRDSRYLRHLITLECSVPGCACKPCDPHHILAAGKGLKCDDYYAAPLCRNHHDRYESVNVDPAYRAHIRTACIENGYKQLVMWLRDKLVVSSEEP